MPLSLIKRLVLGHKITPAQEDQNMTDIENAINGFEAELAVALNPDGTLKNGSVSTASIQDRAVTLAKLAFLSNFYAVDAGAVNAMHITFTPPCPAYQEGDVFWVKVIATNTGACTLAVDSLAAVSVKKPKGVGLTDLVQGELVVNSVYVFVHDGTQFICINPTPLNTLIPVINDDSQQLSTRFGSDVTFAHGLATIPFSQWFLLCTVADVGFAPGNEIDVSGVWIEGTPVTDYEPLITPWATAAVVAASVTPTEAGLSVIVNKGAAEVVLNSTRWKLRNKFINLYG